MSTLHKNGEKEKVNAEKYSVEMLSLWKDMDN